MLISELKDILVIRVEKNVGYLPILYGSCGVIGQSHASLHRRGRGEKTDLNIFIVVAQTFTLHKDFYLYFP